MSSQVDHLVVAAPTLAEGVRWCEATLGVTPGPGGQHVLMGTHNRLLAIGGEAYPEAYLEIIAIDPEAAPPARVRWFGLDDAGLQRSLHKTGPRLLHVVARTTQLEMQRWGLVALGLDVGAPITGGRDTPAGPLRWQIVVRDDGALLAGGALPTLIQWDGRHPASSMPASGVTLSSLQIDGISPAARDVLRLRGVRCNPDAATPGLTATLQTPRGAVTLASL